jgi:3-methylcrotonyl-CoA carboxylase beta subunit
MAAIDPGTSLELGLWAGLGDVRRMGRRAGGGRGHGIGNIAGRRHMIIANDATVKAGAFFPATAKKVLRAQRIAMQNRLPLVYLVDSAGVFLPLQEDVFPDEDDFGRIFRNNAVISAAGIPQIAAIMGNCVAGGGYLPVLCDKLLMTEGSGCTWPDRRLVKSAIGQRSIRTKNSAARRCTRDQRHDRLSRSERRSCLARCAAGGAMLRPDPPLPAAPFMRVDSAAPPKRPAPTFIRPREPDPRKEYEVREVLDCIVDAGTFDEYKPEYGQTLVCGTARIGGFPVGIVANQHHRVRRRRGRSNSAACCMSIAPRRPRGS